MTAGQVLQGFLHVLQLLHVVGVVLTIIGEQIHFLWPSKAPKRCKNWGSTVWLSRYGYSKAFQISSCLWLFALKHALKPCAAKHLVAFVICHNETCFCRCFLATNAASGPYLSSKGAELGATSSLSSASFILSVAKDQRRSASRSTSMTARLRLKS